MQDLAEIARQSFLARYPPNGQVEVKENRHSIRTPNTCVSCGLILKMGTRVRFRVERQLYKRKWTFNGVDTFYLCPGCFQMVMAVISGGI